MNVTDSDCAQIILNVMDGHTVADYAKKHSLNQGNLTVRVKKFIKNHFNLNLTITEFVAKYNVQQVRDKLTSFTPVPADPQPSPTKPKSVKVKPPRTRSNEPKKYTNYFGDAIRVFSKITTEQDNNDIIIEVLKSSPHAMVKAGRALGMI